MKTSIKFMGILAAGTLLSVSAVSAGSVEDAKTVADLDTQFQQAVKDNDAATMGRILADDMILVTGKGHIFGKARQVADAQKGDTIYEHQEELPGTQKVRVWGDMAVVTALLWIKGKSESGSLDVKLWFSDVYLRSPSGWHYTFGQASLALPPESK